MTSQSRKRILIIGINFKPELTGIGKYTGEMIDWFIDKGYDVSIVTGFPYYPYWKIQEPYNGNFYRKETFNNGKLKIYRCPLYVPSEPTGLKRQIHEASFFLSAMLMVLYLSFKQKYESLICIAPPFHLGLIGLLFKFLRKATLVYHVQDLQIDAAQVLGILKSNFVFKVLFKIEKIILKNADVVTTISEGMQRKIHLKTSNKVELLPNWVDTDAFYPIEHRESVREKWNFKNEYKIVLYSGSIGEKQGLEVLLQIAQNLEKNPEIKFIICGIGPFKKRLMIMAKEMSLNNVTFMPLQPYGNFNEFLNLADVHLVLQKADASDLVMPSKLTTILAVGGLAIVTANSGTTLHDVIRDNNMGYLIEPDKPLQLEQAILYCCQNDFSSERRNARNYAMAYLDRNSALSKIEEYIA